MDNSDQETAILAGQLTQHGVKLLVPRENAVPTAPISPVRLISDLAQHPSPRLRDSLIALFLRRPEYAVYVPDLVAILPDAAAATLRHLYTAAVFLQRFWHITLTIYLGQFPLLPDYFGQSHYQLPPPDERFGEPGLRQLAQKMEQNSGYEWLTIYQSYLNLLLRQLEQEVQHESAIGGGQPTNGEFSPKIK